MVETQLRPTTDRRSGQVPWSRLALGVAAMAVGVAITFKPFASLGSLLILIAVALFVLGIAEILATRDVLGRVAGGLLVLLGVAAIVLPGSTIGLFADIAGIGLVVSGIAAIVAAWRGTASSRYTAATGGLARVLLGAVALSWPDVTLLVIALLIGPVAVIVGGTQAAGALRPRTDPTGPRRRPRLAARILRTALVTFSLLLAVATTLVSIQLHGGSPSVTAFYVPPATVPAAPGQLIRSEPFHTGMPPGSTAWRILYTTTKADGAPGVASGLVVIGGPSATPRPVIAWTHGTTGVAQKCAPSLLAAPFGSGAMPDLQPALDRGWAVVATDYIGLGTAGPHPYLVGKPAAYSELDAVRAARQLPAAGLGQQTVAWGHSQGGGAALWVGMEQRAYAPDVPLSGVAAMAPASDLVGLMRGILSSPIGKLFGPYLISGYSATYPDVHTDDYIRPAAQAITATVNSRCLSEPATAASLATVLAPGPIFTAGAAGGPLATRLAQNIPDSPTGIPTFIAQGAADPLVLPAVQGAFVASLCRKGQSIDYRTYTGLDHMGIVLAPDSAMPADLLSWTQDRLAGKPQQGCRTTTR